MCVCVTRHLRSTVYIKKKKQTRLEGRLGPNLQIGVNTFQIVFPAYVSLDFVQKRCETIYNREKQTSLKNRSPESLAYFSTKLVLGIQDIILVRYDIVLVRYDIILNIEYIKRHIQIWY